MGVLEVVLAANDKRNLYFGQVYSFVLRGQREIEQGDMNAATLHLIPAGGAALSPSLLSLLICPKA